jgi:predicted nucleotide-binding protein
MADINPTLLAAIIKKTGLQRAQVYVRIKQTASNELLPRHLAAIRVAADVGLTINKYATPDELAQLRSAGSPVAPPPVFAVAASGSARSEKKHRPTKQSGPKAPNSVFVVHGRDNDARNAMFTFLRAVGITPIEWTSALKMSKKAAPYIGEILETAFSRARAIVVLMTPDDLAQLRPDLILTSDKPYERTPTGQARPNVLFEAGMAFATHPDRTVMVQLGHVREFSDIAGRHVVHMSNEFPKRQELATKLKNAGCIVDTSGTDWAQAGDFIDPQSRVPTRSPRKRRMPIKLKKRQPEK